VVVVSIAPLHRRSRFGCCAVVGFGALFGFHHEAGAFVEVDEVGGAFAVAVVEPEGFVVDVGVVAFVLAGETLARDGEQVAQLVAEGLEVGPLGGRRGVPATDDVFDGGFDLGCGGGVPISAARTNTRDEVISQ
jgi:hypothetical protein